MVDRFVSHITFAAIQGSLLFFAVWLICLAFRRLPALWKCWLWRLVSLKFLISLIFAVTIPIGLVRTKPDSGPISRVTHSVFTKIAQVNVVEPAQADSATATPPTTQSHQPVPASTYLIGLWIAGIGIVLARDLAGWSRMRRLLDRSEGERVFELPDSTRQVLVLSGYWAPVRVKRFNDLPAPAIAGLFQPTILLPSDFESTSPEALSSALAHELAHLRRRDIPWVVMSAAVRAIFWFNPLVWVAYHEQRTESEIAADQLARTWTETSPKDYGLHLLEWITPDRKRQPAVAVPGMLLYTHELTRRMKAMQIKRYNRRSTVLLGVTLAVPLLFGLTPVNFVRSADSGLVNSAWPKFRGGRNNSGLGSGSGATGQKKWAFKGGGFDSSPSIGADGTIYVGSWDHNLYAIDGNTGLKKWSCITDDSVQSSPAIGLDGTVYVGSWDGWVYALDGANGTRKWTFQTKAGVYASPSIGADGTVYIGSEDGIFYALDGSSGVKKWSFKTNDIICSTPAVGEDGAVYFGSNDECVYAVDGQTGAKKWSFKTGGAVVSSPAIGPDGTIYVGSWDNALFALDAKTGAAKWVFKTKGPVKSSPAVAADGTVYVGSFDHNFYAIDGKNGTQKWEFKTKDGFNSSAAIGGDGTVYVGAWDHNLYALDGASGVKKWSFKTGGSIGGSPTVGSDGTVYFGSSDRNVYALR